MPCGRGPSVRARRGDPQLVGAQPSCTLIGAIDDATGRVLALIPRAQEDLHGYTALLGELVTHHGVPWTLYGDRAAVLVRNDRHWTIDEELEGRQRPSHFGLMLEELGIRYIAASPRRPRAASSACGARCRTASPPSWPWTAAARTNG